MGLSVGPDTLESLSHLSQLMMMFPSARHMDSVVLSKSLFQSDPREYFRTVLQVPSFLSCALITLSPVAAMEICLGIWLTMSVFPQLYREPLRPEQDLIHLCGSLSWSPTRGSIAPSIEGQPTVVYWLESFGSLDSSTNLSFLIIVCMPLKEVLKIDSWTR